MNISSIDKTISNVLKSSYYKIPRFQRPYSWEREHIEDFWNDVIQESESDYFIGSMVVYQITEDTYGVVDGQQRLTTITMFLGALREAFKHIEQVSLARGIQSVIERTDLNDELNFVLQNESSYPFFHENVQKYEESDVSNIPSKKEEEFIQKGYEIISALIMKDLESVDISTSVSDDKKDETKIELLKSIRNKVLQLKVIYIELGSEDDAYVIFETLNTRGKDLRVSDLVKNHLTKMIPKKNKSIDLTRDKWTESRTIIEGSSLDLNMDSFLHHFWLSKYEFTTQKKLFKFLKKKVKKNNSKSFLDDILKEATIYRETLDVSYREWKKEEVDLKNSLQALYIFKVKQQIPMLQSVMREYEAGNLKLKHVKNIIGAIEKFHFIFTAVTSQRSSGGISFMYAYHARQLNDLDIHKKIESLQELKEKLIQKLPSKDEFIANFLEIRYSSTYTKEKALVKYILTEYDKYFHSDSGIVTDYSLMTIEHIHAEKSTTDIFENSDKIGCIGNLILIESSLNTDLANKNFKEKHEAYLNTKLFIDEKLKSATYWNEEKVIERTKFIAEQIFDDVFKIKA